MEKSYRAVLFPSQFPAFEGADPASVVAERWRDNRPWVLANMAHAAYHPGDVITHLMARLGATRTQVYARDGAQAFLATWPDKAILAFRGTEPRDSGGQDGLAGLLEVVRQAAITPTLRRGRDALELVQPVLRLILGNDIAADLDFPKVPLTAGSPVAVHRGFLREIDKLWGDDLLLGGLRGLPAASRPGGGVPAVPVWATGHSLGGAMATLAATRWPFEEVVTFGEPRVGIGLGRPGVFTAGGHVRYVNGDDPVPGLPPSERPFDYQHHGRVVRIGDPDDRADFRFDHAIVYYAANLARP